MAFEGRGDGGGMKRPLERGPRGVALALKRAGKLKEMSFLEMLEKLEIDESVFRREQETFEAFENLIFQTEERIKL